MVIKTRDHILRVIYSFVIVATCGPASPIGKTLLSRSRRPQLEVIAANEQRPTMMDQSLNVPKRLLDAQLMIDRVTTSDILYFTAPQ
jgi:hypothetical protein